MGLSENRVFLSIHCFIIVSFCWFIWLCLRMNYCKWSIALNSLIGNMMIKHRTWWYDTRFSNKPTCLGQLLDLEISDELDGPTKTFTLKSPKRALRILVKSIIPFINPNVGEIICYINPFFVRETTKFLGFSRSFQLSMHVKSRQSAGFNLRCQSNVTLKVVPRKISILMPHGFIPLHFLGILRDTRKMSRMSLNHPK